MNWYRFGIIAFAALLGAALSSTALMTLTSIVMACLAITVIISAVGLSWCLSAENDAVNRLIDLKQSEAEAWFRQEASMRATQRPPEKRQAPLPADVLNLYEEMTEHINAIREEFGLVTKLASTAKLNAADAYDQLSHANRRIGDLEVYAATVEQAMAPLSGMKAPLSLPHPFRRTEALKHVDSIMAPLQAAIEGRETAEAE
jgi:hypothetical protein